VEVAQINYFVRKIGTHFPEVYSLSPKILGFKPQTWRESKNFCKVFL